MIKQFEARLNELERKNPKFFITRAIVEYKIKNIKARIKELKEDVIIRKNMKKIKTEDK